MIIKLIKSALLTAATLVVFLYSSGAMADGESGPKSGPEEMFQLPSYAKTFDAERGGTSLHILYQLYGPIYNGIYGKPAPKDKLFLFADVLKYWNFLIASGSVLFITYHLLTGFARTAENGKFLGGENEKVGSILRFSMGGFLVAPVLPGGSCAMQAFFLTAILQGVHMANLIWGKATQDISLGATPTIPSNVTSTLNNLAGRLYLYNRIDSGIYALLASNRLGNSGAYTTGVGGLVNLADQPGFESLAHALIDDHSYHTLKNLSGVLVEHGQGGKTGTADAHRWAAYTNNHQVKTADTAVPGARSCEGVAPYTTTFSVFSETGVDEGDRTTEFPFVMGATDCVTSTNVQEPGKQRSAESSAWMVGSGSPAARALAYMASECALSRSFPSRGLIKGHSGGSNPLEYQCFTTPMHHAHSTAPSTHHSTWKCTPGYTSSGTKARPDGRLQCAPADTVAISSSTDSAVTAYKYVDSYQPGEWVLSGVKLDSGTLPINIVNEGRHDAGDAGSGFEKAVLQDHAGLAGSTSEFTINQDTGLPKMLGNNGAVGVENAKQVSLVAPLGFELGGIAQNWTFPVLAGNGSLPYKLSGEPLPPPNCPTMGGYQLPSGFSDEGMLQASNVLTLVGYGLVSQTASHNKCTYRCGDWDWKNGGQHEKDLPYKENRSATCDVSGKWAGVSANDLRDHCKEALKQMDCTLYIPPTTAGMGNKNASNGEMCVGNKGATLCDSPAVRLYGKYYSMWQHGNLIDISLDGPRDAYFYSPVHYYRSNNKKYSITPRNIAYGDNVYVHFDQERIS